MRRIASSLAVLLLFAASALAADPPEKDPAKPKPTQAELEKQFGETLSGASLVGHFTATGKEEDKPLTEERYTLTKVSKLQGDMWLFQTRIQYNKHDVNLPLPLEVKWAGDTPIITLTDLAIPGFGTFTARVIIYRGQYAGTWSGGDHGGHLFGKIVKEADDKAKPEKPAKTLGDPK
jgi:hypothetical protein